MKNIQYHTFGYTWNSIITSYSATVNLIFWNSSLSMKTFNCNFIFSGTSKNRASPRNNCIRVGAFPALEWLETCLCVTDVKLTLSSPVQVQVPWALPGSLQFDISLPNVVGKHVNGVNLIHPYKPFVNTFFLILFFGQKVHLLYHHPSLNFQSNYYLCF